MLKAIEEKNFIKNYITTNILECMKFWNREGEIAIEKNKSGEWGSRETNEMAKTMDADDFILQMMLIDCKTFCNSDTAKKIGNFEYGRTRSHVWVHFNNERVLMIHA